jgi:hypothetical protein
MKTPALLLFGYVLCAASAFSQTASEIRDRIVGTWKLVSAVDIMKDGTTRPFPIYGPHGKGFLMFAILLIRFGSQPRPNSVDDTVSF